MIKVYDIETFPNCFTYTDIDVDTLEMREFVVSDFRNDYDSFVEYMNLLEKKKAGMVGFNNLFFDWPIVRAMYKEGLSTGEKIYQMAQSIIENKQRTYTKEEILQLDLYLLNHYDNKARRTSLKALEVSLGWDNVQDMPFAHTEIIDPIKLKSVLEYNQNDVLFTAEFYKACKSKIDMRKAIKKKYRLNVLNKSDVVIGESIFIKYLSNSMNISTRELRDIRGKRRPVPLKEIIFDYVQFRDPKLQKLLGIMQTTVASAQYLKEFIENVNTGQKTNELFDLFKDNNIIIRQLAQRKKSFSYKITYADLIVDYGVGGVHACIPPGVYQPNNNQILLDIDVKSYYPNLFIQNRLHPRQMDQETFIEVYSDIFQQRVQAQKEGDKLTSDALKLALNGLFGKTGSDVSCFYDPYVFYAVTVNGQLLMTMLVESLYELGLQILQINTDGVTVMFDKSKAKQVGEVCQKWEKITKLTLEYSRYSKMIVRDVNNYIAVSEDGKIKEKGAFETSKDWHKDNSYMVVPLAVKQYFVNGTPIEKTLSEHKNILDFCGRYKAGGGWHVEYIYLDGNYEKRLNFGKIYRYLPVYRGGTSMKINLDGREHHLCEGYQTMPYNKKEIFDMSNINMRFFENECRKLIETIEPKQLKLL